MIGWSENITLYQVKQMLHLTELKSKCLRSPKLWALQEKLSGVPGRTCCSCPWHDSPDNSSSIWHKTICWDYDQNEALVLLA